MLKTTLKAVTAAALLAGSAVAAYAQEYTIRATANSNENDEDYDGLVVFKSFVEAASNGAVEVELFIGTQLCANGAECLQGVADGSVDVYISTSGGAAGIFPYVQVLDLPYLMADDRIAEAVLSGDFTRTMRDISVPCGINHNLRQQGLSARFGFCDDPRDAIPVHNWRDEQTVQHRDHARWPARSPSKDGARARVHGFVVEDANRARWFWLSKAMAIEYLGQVCRPKAIQSCADCDGTKNSY